MYSGFKTCPFPTDTDNETPCTNTTNKEENTEPENIKTQPDLNSQTNSHSQDIRKLVTPVSFDIGRRQKSSTQKSSPIVVINQCIDSSSSEASIGKKHIVSNNFTEDDLFLSQPPSIHQLYIDHI